MLVLCLVVEPTWTDAGIRLSRTPHVAIFYPIVQHLIRHVTIVIEQAPVGLTHIAGLRAYPTQIAPIAAVIPDEALGLQFPDHPVGLRPLVIGGTIDLARLVGSTIPAVATIGAVEPHLENVTIVRQQFA